MSTQIKYIVKRPFKYDGVQYSPGEEWEPAGSRFDKSIIDSDKYVRVERTEKPRHKKREVSP